MKKKIIIIDNSNLSYSGEDINGLALRGTETSLILLAEQFIRIGIEVHFCNNILETKVVNGVQYFNKNKICNTDLYNLAIAVSDANQFDDVYALKKAVKCKSKLILSDYYKIPFKNKYFDFVIAFNSLYMQNLGDVIKSLKEIERVSKKSYIVLASGENDQERNKFYRWTLIGTSILLKKEWKTLFKKIKFKGDYYFSSAKSLGV